MQQTRAAVVGGAGQASQPVKTCECRATAQLFDKIAPAADIGRETRFVLCHLQRPRGLLYAKTTRLQLGNYLCVASK